MSTEQTIKMNADEMFRPSAGVGDGPSSSSGMFMENQHPGGIYADPGVADPVGIVDTLASFFDPTSKEVGDQDLLATLGVPAGINVADNTANIKEAADIGHQNDVKVNHTADDGASNKAADNKKNEANLKEAEGQRKAQIEEQKRAGDNPDAKNGNGANHEQALQQNENKGNSPLQRLAGNLVRDTALTTFSNMLVPGSGLVVGAALLANAITPETAGKYEVTFDSGLSGKRGRARSEPTRLKMSVEEVRRQQAREITTPAASTGPQQVPAQLAQPMEIQMGAENSSMYLNDPNLFGLNVNMEENDPILADLRDAKERLQERQDNLHAYQEEGITVAEAVDSGLDDEVTQQAPEMDLDAERLRMQLKVQQTLPTVKPTLPI